MSQAPDFDKDIICYVGFIVSANGVISHIEPYEKDEFGLYTTALDIMATCGIKFTPGKIDGKEVSSFVYFPFEFKK